MRSAGACGRITVRADSGFYFHDFADACGRAGARFSVSARMQPALRELIKQIPAADWTPIPYWLEGGAWVAEISYIPFRHLGNASPVRLIVRRTRPSPGSLLDRLPDFRYLYHPFITDRAGDMLELEADHRRHAEVENAIKDLKYGVGLNHLPSGRFNANAAWLAVQVTAHNLARWTARIGIGGQAVTTPTLRRRIFSVPGRITRSGRRYILHLPRRWPWAQMIALALTRLRALALPA